MSMAKEEKKSLSAFKQREALSYETWLCANNLRVEKNGKMLQVPLISIFGGNDGPADAVLVVGDNFRAAAEAAQFLHHQNRKFGVYPKVICVSGFNTPAWIDYGHEASFWLKFILMRLGIPKAEVKRYDPPFGDNPTPVLVNFFAGHRELKKVAVFSSRGYSLTVAQELFLKLPEISWSFFENPVIQLEERIFDAEIIGENGFAVDLMLANIAHSCQDWEIRRCRLSAESQNNFPKMDVMAKFLLKGYALGMKGYRDWNFFGIKPSVGIILSNGRKDDFRRMKENPRQYVRRQVEQLIGQYKPKIDSL